MVESSLILDRIFGALADGTRRDILRRITQAECSISELAEPYAISLAAVAKHVSVLEKAGLVRKQRRGKEKLVYVRPEMLEVAAAHLSEYERVWGARFDALERLLIEQEAEKREGGT